MVVFLAVADERFLSGSALSIWIGAVRGWLQPFFWVAVLVRCIERGASGSAPVWVILP